MNIFWTLKNKMVRLLWCGDDGGAALVEDKNGCIEFAMLYDLREVCG